MKTTINKIILLLTVLSLGTLKTNAQTFPEMEGGEKIYRSFCNNFKCELTLFVTSGYDCDGDKKPDSDKMVYYAPIKLKPTSCVLVVGYTSKVYDCPIVTQDAWLENDKGEKLEVCKDGVFFSPIQFTSGDCTDPIYPSLSEYGEIYFNTDPPKDLCPKFCFRNETGCSGLTITGYIKGGDVYCDGKKEIPYMDDRSKTLILGDNHEYPTEGCLDFTWGEKCTLCVGEGTIDLNICGGLNNQTGTIPCMPGSSESHGQIWCDDCACLLDVYVKLIDGVYVIYK